MKIATTMLSSSLFFAARGVQGYATKAAFVGRASSARAFSNSAMAMANPKGMSM